MAVLGFVALILYGSLFPFDLRPGVTFDLVAMVRQLRLLRPSRGDLVSNLLLYMPLGFCLVLAAPLRARRWAATALAVLAGTLLSVGVELAQTFEASRVPSLTDVLLNLVGSWLGAVGAMGYLALGTDLHIPGMLDARPAPIPLAALLLWISYRLAPFVPTIDWQKYKEALKPIFLVPTVSTLETIRYLAGWLAVSQAIRGLWRREFAAFALIACAALVVLGRIVIVSKVLVLSEIIALALLLPAFVACGRMSQRGRALLIGLLVLGVIVVEGLRPFEFLETAQSFSWIPFRTSLSDNLELNYTVLLEKSFLYLSLAGLLTRAGMSIAVATISEALLLATLEVAQIWLPGRSAEITDPLLALVAGVALWLAGQARDEP